MGAEVETKLDGGEEEGRSTSITDVGTEGGDRGGSRRVEGG